MAVSGAFHVRRTLRLLSEAAQTEVKDAIQRGAEMIYEDAEGRVPRNTGALAKNISINISPDGFQAKIGVQGFGARHAYYAKWIEYGTVKMAAQPFLNPALDSKGPAILKIIEDAVSRALDTARNNPSGDEPL